MARQTKTGLDYFSLDVNMDTKIKLVEAKFGLQGFAILIKLYQHIYLNGYYCDWKEDDVLVFCLENNIQEELMLTLIEFMLTKNIFDKSLYEKYSVLTSSGIQKRYIQGTQRRKNIEYIKEYLLIQITPETYPKYVNVNINSLNANINPLNADKSTQSKVKESKVKESKVTNTIRETKVDPLPLETECSCPNPFDNKKIKDINDAAIQKGMVGVTTEFIDDCEVWISDGVEPELIIKALTKAVDSASSSKAVGRCNYARKIMQSWMRDGVKTVQDYNKKVEAVQNKSSPNKITPRGNFGQRQYSDEYLNSLYEN